MIRALCILIAAVCAVNGDVVFTRAANSFAADIYQKAVEGKSGNVMISPASIQSAVSLAMFGATGQTQAEMLHGLKYPDQYSTNSIADGFKAFNDYVGKSGALQIANKIFIMKGFSVKQTFQQVATKSFKSEAQNLDFAQTQQSAGVINSWVEQQTDHKIKDLIKPTSLSVDTRMVLVNAIYFKGNWKHPFDKFATSKAPFYLNEQDSVQTDFMRSTKAFKYGMFANIDASVLELPYEDTDITMMIILPNTRTGLKELEKKFGTDFNFHDMSLLMVSKDLVNVQIPKFKIEFETELNEPLKKMGMKKMFSNGAEFDGLLDKTGNLAVSEVVHKAFIEVDEVGTRAGAATGIEISTRMRQLTIPFKADHPFLFVIRSPTTTLFMGRVVRF